MMHDKKNRLSAIMIHTVTLFIQHNSQCCRILPFILDFKYLAIRILNSFAMNNWTHVDSISENTGNMSEENDKRSMHGTKEEIQFSAE